jgi:hypothetical protein
LAIAGHQELAEQEKGCRWSPSRTDDGDNGYCVDWRDHISRLAWRVDA